MSLLLRKLLSRFLSLPAVEGDPDASPNDDTPAGADADADAGGDTLDDIAALEDPPEEVSRGTGDPPPDEPAAIKRARAETERVNRELEAERRARQLLEQQVPRQQNRDPVFDAEEKRLADARAAGATQETIGWLQWQIQTDRTNRQVRNEAQAALAESRDLADRTAFNQLAVTKPALHKRYEKRVEAEMDKIRNRGERLPPREAVLAYLAGQDVINGIGKKAPAKPAPTQVDRGRMPQTRSDVSGRAGGASEREKRRERLRNTPI